MNRRGMLAGLLCSPVLAERNQINPKVIDFGKSKPDTPVLEVRYNGETIRLTAEQVMEALRIPPMIMTDPSYPSILAGHESNTQSRLPVKGQ